MNIQPLTGVISGNSVNFERLNDDCNNGIDLHLEAYMAENPDTELDDYYDDSPLYLIGDWLKDDKGLYYPNPEGEFAAIVSYDAGCVIQVVHSKHTAMVRSMCSPCYPNQADIDSGIGEILAYTLPKEYFQVEN